MQRHGLPLEDCEEEGYGEYFEDRQAASPLQQSLQQLRWPHSPNLSMIQHSSHGTYIKSTSAGYSPRLQEIPRYQRSPGSSPGSNIASPNTQNGVAANTNKVFFPPTEDGSLENTPHVFNYVERTKFTSPAKKPHMLTPPSFPLHRFILNTLSFIKLC